MKVIEPVAVTDAVLVSSTVAEDDYANWSSSVPYAQGARVIRAGTHRIFESLVAANLNDDPATSTTGKWLEVGATNRWKMFDQAVGSATTAFDAIETVLAPGVPVEAVGIVDTDAATVRVQVIVSSVAIYDTTQAAAEDAAGGASMLFLDLPAVASAQIIVTASAADVGETVEVGTLVLGTVLDLGLTEVGPQVGINDFSRRETDDFGVTTVLERPWAKRMSLRSIIATTDVDDIQRRLAALRAMPSLWIGEEGYESLTLYGYFKEFSIDLALSTISYCTLTIEGLTSAPELVTVQSALSALLTNETHTLPADADGNVLSYAGATGQFKVFSGSQDVSSLFALSTVSNPQALTVGYSDQTYTVTGGLDAGEPAATLVIRATGAGEFAGLTIEKTFSLAKSSIGGDGEDGHSAITLTVLSDRQTIAYDPAGLPSPTAQTTVFSTNRQNSTATVTWTITDANGVARTPVTNFLSAATGDSVTMTEPQFDAARNGTSGVIVTASIFDGSTIEDKISVVRVKAGAPGANAMAAFLTNETHTLPADGSGNVINYDGATGNFVIYAGQVDVSALFTLSTVSNPQSLAVTYSGISYQVTGGLDAPEASATLTIRATGSGPYAGLTIDKQFSLAKSSAGSAGAPARLFSVLSDRQTISYDAAGNAAPATQTTIFGTNKQNTTALVNWTITDAAGAPRTPVTSFLSAASGDTVQMTAAQFEAARNGTPGVIVTGTIVDGITLIDRISVVKVQAGAPGADGLNAIINSEFIGGLQGHYPGWDGNTGLPVTRGYNLDSSWSGILNVAYATVTGTPAAGTVFDGFCTLGEPPTGNLPALRRWGLVVSPGDRLYFSMLVAGHRCNPCLTLQFADANGYYLSPEAGSPQAPLASSTPPRTDFAYGDPTQATLVGAFATVPAGARFAYLEPRAVCPGGLANPYMFYSRLFLAIVSAAQTTPPPYTPGPTDRAGDAVMAFIRNIAEQAQATADGKIDTFFQPTPPAGSYGDIWFDTDDGNKQYRHNGAGWELAQDVRIGQAIVAAAGAQATADGKVRTFVSESAPGPTAVGDLWVKPSTRALYRWSGIWERVSAENVQDGATYGAPNGLYDDGTVKPGKVNPDALVPNVAYARTNLQSSTFVPAPAGGFPNYMAAGVEYVVVSGTFAKSRSDSSLKITAIATIWSSNDISVQWFIRIRQTGTSTWYDLIPNTGYPSGYYGTAGWAYGELGTKYSDWASLVVSDNNADSMIDATRTVFSEANALGAAAYDIQFIALKATSYGDSHAILPGATLSVEEFKKQA